VFQNGSSFVYNNVNAANPFGLAAPGSKVRFEKGSNFIFDVNASSPFSVDGRSFPNLIILNGINVSISDTLTHGISMDSVIISPGSSLEIINTNNSSSGSVNINGSLQVDGTLRIGNNSAGINNIIFSGTGIQNIGGSGALDFSCSSSVFINNDIKLFRDLILNCTVNNSSAIIYSPGYRFVVKGKTLNTQPIPESTNKGTFANSISPLSYELKQNYPNPFNSQTAVEFSLASDTHVDLKLFDVMGRLVSEILSSNLSAGRHKINFDSKDISSGVYFYTINAGSFTKTLKMIVVK
jgi:hypothetical protein